MTDYPEAMNAVGLPARIIYATVALPLGGAVGFYGGIWLLPRFAGAFMRVNPSNLQGYGMFESSVELGIAFAFMAFLLGLTLPKIRHRKHRGRSQRMTIAGIFVVLASLAFAGEGHPVSWDLAFAAWLAYTVALTYVRYGVIDRARRSSASAEAAS